MGTYTFTPTTTVAGVTTLPASTSFAVSAGTASQLVFTQQPSAVVAGATMSPAVTVTVADGNGNLGLRVTNRSPFALRNVRVAGAVLKTDFHREYVLPGSLPAGKSAVVAMGVNLADFSGGLGRVSGQVRSADIAE